MNRAALFLGLVFIAAEPPPAWAEGAVTVQVTRGGKLTIRGTGAAGEAVRVTQDQAGDVVVTGIAGTTVDGEASRTFPRVRTLRCHAVDQCRIVGVTVARLDVSEIRRAGSVASHVDLRDCTVRKLRATVMELRADHCTVDAFTASACSFVYVDTDFLDASNEQTGVYALGGSRFGRFSIRNTRRVYLTSVVIGQRDLPATTITGTARLGDDLRVRSGVSSGVTSQRYRDLGEGAQNVTFGGSVYVAVTTGQGGDRLSMGSCAFSGPVLQIRREVRVLDSEFTGPVKVKGGRGEDFLDVTGTVFTEPPRIVSVEQILGLADAP